MQQFEDHLAVGARKNLNHDYYKFCFLQEGSPPSYSFFWVPLQPAGESRFSECVHVVDNIRYGMCVSGFPHDNKRAWFSSHYHCTRPHTHMSFYWYQ